jgi:hypothetical protein
MPRTVRRSSLRDVTDSNMDAGPSAVTLYGGFVLYSGGDLTNLTRIGDKAGPSRPPSHDSEVPARLPVDTYSRASALSLKMEVLREYDWTGSAPHPSRPATVPMRPMRHVSVRTLNPPPTLFLTYLTAVCYGHFGIVKQVPEVCYYIGDYLPSLRGFPVVCCEAGIFHEYESMKCATWEPWYTCGVVQTTPSSHAQHRIPPKIPQDVPNLSTSPQTWDCLDDHKLINDRIIRSFTISFAELHTVVVHIC